MANKNRLVFLPLGGAGEIGMNMYLYGYGPEGKERFILVDAGVTFPSMDGTPGVDLIMPDTAWIEARADRLDGIFITHAHEDHIGALGHLYARLPAPIYTRVFTGAVARAKLDDHGQDVDQVHVLEAWPDQVELGPFKVGFMPVAHSIPEASGLVIDTPKGRIVHTGDFKTDPEPIVGEPHNPAMLKEIAGGGVHALICDSTNVFSPLAGRSESTLQADITALVKRAEGMMVATTFASNVARLKTLAQAGVDAGRSVVVLGRAMQRMLGYANFAGVLDNFPPTIDLEDVGDIPRNNLMLLVTGSQGEGRAASAQLARGKYRGMEMREGDTFLFSSKTIPGNEVSVGNIMNSFSKMGVNVVDESDGNYHVSGHANRPDLEEIHALMRPKMLIPMHGEHRHLRAHAELAESKGIKAAIAPNGTMLDLSGDAPEVVDNIETGRIYLDGTRLIGAFDGVVLERIRMATRGAVVVSVLLEDNRLLGESWAEIMGLPDTSAMQTGLQEAVETAVDQELLKAKKNRLASDEEVESLVAKAVSRTCRDLVGKKPVCKVLINRLVDG
ncbi:MAG: ribonuclease J [Rhodobacteraceae bacterium]|nr:ribonuclease J [Paracoccaceae bacterium]